MDVTDKGDCRGVLSSDSVMDAVTLEEDDALGCQQQLTPVCCLSLISGLPEAACHHEKDEKPSLPDRGQLIPQLQQGASQIRPSTDTLCVWIKPA